MNFISCLCNCFASINKDCLTSFLSGLVAFLVTTVVILFVFLIFGGFWVVFNNIVNDPFFGEYWFIPATLLIIALLCIICLLLWHLYDAITSCPLDSETKELINIIFNILFSFLFLMFFIITFVLIMVIFYLIFEYIIYADLSKNRVFTNRFISAILALLGFFGSLALYFSGLFALLINCHE
ncbi:unnamed protein product [Meloidogyne enterolobii]|uniref:Uncharacterized protein n=1 Tax=Meloidogyne enterolobii TaxID=390850 RepID=A0ACB1AYA2_MELEN